MEQIKTNIYHYATKLSNVIIAANLSYEIWWELSGPNRPKYVDILNDYLSFWSSTISAHFTSLIILLYKLYDRNPKTLSFNRLFKLIKKHNIFTDNEYMILISKLEQAKIIWEKIKILRNEYYAHLSYEADTVKIYKKAEIKPNQFKELINLSKDIINSVYANYHNGEIVFWISAKDETSRILNKLKNSVPNPRFT